MKWLLNCFVKQKEDRKVNNNGYKEEFMLLHNRERRRLSHDLPVRFVYTKGEFKKDDLVDLIRLAGQLPYNMKIKINKIEHYGVTDAVSDKTLNDIELKVGYKCKVYYTAGALSKYKTMILQPLWRPQYSLSFVRGSFEMNRLEGLIWQGHGDYVIEEMALVDTQFNGYVTEDMVNTLEEGMVPLRVLSVCNKGYEILLRSDLVVLYVTSQRKGVVSL